MVGLTTITGLPLIDMWLSAIFIALLAAVTLFATFTVGYFLAKVINMIIRKALKAIRFEEWVEDHELQNALLGFRVTKIITVWVKVFVIIAALGFGFSAVEAWLGMDLFITTQIILPFKDYLIGLAGSLIVIGGSLFIGKYISNHVKKGDFLFSRQIAAAIYLAIAYFVIVATLPTLLPGPGTQIAELLKYFIIALVFGIGLAIGLAFGLGLKDVVSKSAVKNQEAIEKYILRLGKK